MTKCRNRWGEMIVSNCGLFLRVKNFDLNNCVLKTVTKMYDYVFSENGLVAYKDGELVARQVSSISSITAQLA